MIKAFFINETIRERSEISTLEMRNLNTIAFMRNCKDKGGKEIRVPNLYKSDSVKKAATAIIIQAIGRVCRTPNKRLHIHILGDRALVDMIDTSVLDSMPLNVECAEFFRKIRNEKQPTVVKEDAFQKLINKAETRCLRTGGYIERQLNNISRHTQSAETISGWRSQRETAKRYPTMDGDTAEKSMHSQFYVELPEKKNYLYYKKLNDKGNTRISFEPTSEIRTRLCEENTFLTSMMKHDFLRNHFEDKGYATYWEPNDFIMTPPFCNNIYKGAIGEEAVLAYFMMMFGITLQEVNDPIKIEKMDFVIPNTGIYIDAKNWHTYMTVSREDYLGKIHTKMDICGATCAMILNVMNEDENKYNEWDEDRSDGNVLMIPALIPANPKNMNAAWVIKNANKIEEVIKQYE